MYYSYHVKRSKYNNHPDHLRGIEMTYDNLGIEELDLSSIYYSYHSFDDISYNRTRPVSSDYGLTIITSAELNCIPSVHNSANKDGVLMV